MIIYRKATMKDVENLHQLINDFASQGLMLPRSRNALYETLREFIIAEDEGQFIGTGSLHITWDNLAEIRALAISPQYQHQGIGQKLVAELEMEAKNLYISQVFALTYQVAFFHKCDYRVVSKEEMPQKIWKECINCPKFPKCDEVAMVKNLII